MRFIGILLVVETGQPKTAFSSVTFVKGIAGSDDILEDPKPSVVFVGRSNAGKSSAINTLLGRSVAYTSSTPGKTREINFYLVDDSFHIVDLPGYGYAKLPPAEREKIRKRIIWYLSESGSTPTLVVIVVDIRRGISDLDRDLLDICIGEEYPVLILATKADKLNQKEYARSTKEFDAFLRGLQAIGVTYIPFSSVTKKGREDAIGHIMKKVEEGRG